MKMLIIAQLALVAIGFGFIFSGWLIEESVHYLGIGGIILLVIAFIWIVMKVKEWNKRRISRSNYHPD